MNEHVLSLMGLCRKAGKIAFGYTPVLKSISTGKARLVIITCDIASHTKKSILHEAEKKGTRVVTIDITKEDMNYYIGKYAVVMTIEEEKFAKRISELLAEEEALIELLPESEPKYLPTEITEEENSDEAIEEANQALPEETTKEEI